MHKKGRWGKTLKERKSKTTRNIWKTTQWAKKPKTCVKKYLKHLKCLEDPTDSKFGEKLCVQQKGTENDTNKTNITTSDRTRKENPKQAKTSTEPQKEKPEKPNKNTAERTSNRIHTTITQNKKTGTEKNKKKRRKAKWKQRNAPGKCLYRV